MAKKKNAGLGRGLNAIFLENALNEEKEQNENLVSQIKLSQIDPKSDQPRKYFDKEALETLLENSNGMPFIPTLPLGTSFPPSVPNRNIGD